MSAGSRLSTLLLPPLLSMLMRPRVAVCRLPIQGLLLEFVCCLISLMLMTSIGWFCNYSLDAALVVQHRMNDITNYVIVRRKFKRSLGGRQGATHCREQKKIKSSRQLPMAKKGFTLGDKFTSINP